MTIHWLKVVAGAFFEIFWVIGLSHANSLLTWSGTVIAIFLSFFFLILAAKHLPVGTVYAVFAGLGTAGTVIVDMVFFGEPFQLLKVLFIGILVVGIIGLKFVTEEQGEA
ncbi:DMT family transporter [Alkalibacillus almallahensis]|uniref:DMT family transporter n=1 Tax=Alkalibacillus almallahensis TaxID=1379154 RepID=UPI0014225350|nr:multidrug efflux SMR transporter [Alkalibacillus almallahensis]NIK11358.1 paired small multidrug resistance pump [Alkalibacillus almallahensis]